jgi:hypothetical protein
MHHTVHHQRPEGERGKGDDSEAEGTIVPQPADPPDVFKVSVASVKPIERTCDAPMFGFGN